MTKKMMRSMTRVVVAGCVALAALGVVAVFDVGSSTADAAPSASPFAGMYAHGEWSITISDGGRIAGSFGTSNYNKGSISGRVKDDGSYSYTMNVTYYDQERRGGGPPYIKVTYEYSGSMTPDDDGNILVADDNYGSFTWIRQ